MAGQDQVEAPGVMADHGQPDQRARAQVERFRQVGGEHFLGGSVADPEVGFRGLRYEREVGREHRAQVRVPGQQVGAGAAQRVDVQ